MGRTAASGEKADSHMDYQDENVDALIAWCERERRMMLRQLELIRLGKIQCRGSDDRKPVDEMRDWMDDILRRISELEDLLGIIQSG